MLLRLTIQNFISFQDEESFEMLALSSDKSHQNHIAIDEKNPKRSALRACAIYGANGSGKSTIVKALNVMKELIVDGTKPGQKIAVTPFKLNKKCLKEPTKIEVTFRHENMIFTYGFEATQEHVIQEWLSAVINVKEVNLFERVIDENGKTKVAIYPALAKKGSERHQFLQFLAQGTRANQLYLNAAYEREVDEVQSPLHWFHHDLVIIKPESVYAGLVSELQKGSEFVSYVNRFFSNADTGVTNVITKSIKIDPTAPFMEMPKEILEDMSNMDSNTTFLVRTPDGNPFEIRKNKETGEITMTSLKTQHRDSDGEMVTFDISDESDGTKRLFDLLPALIQSQKDAKVHVVDEIDRSMHPLLTRLFVKAYLSDPRCSNSQLIFTTHETNLLDQDLLRRDEVWFVEKDLHGGSHLSSLVEFKVRPDLKIEKGYLNGRFGAIPFPGNIADIVGE